MAENENMQLIRKIAVCIKSLELTANEKDYTTFLNLIHQLSDYLFSIVKTLSKYQLSELGFEIQENVKNAVTEAKILLKEKTDESLERFKDLLKIIAKTLVRIMNSLRDKINESVRFKKKS